MKKLLVIILAFTVCISALVACGKDNSDTNGANSTVNTPGGNGGNANQSGGTGNSSSAGDNGGGAIKPPSDVLEGLPYTIVCKDKYTGELAEYAFTDNGRLNDGLYRSTEDLGSDANADMCVGFEGTNAYNFVLTFEANGSYDGYRIVAHNCSFTFSFLKIEMGTDLDNMTEIDFEDDHEITVNQHCDNYADFEVCNINIVRITITTGTSSTTSLDEISLLGYPKGQGQIEESSIPPTETSAPPASGERDNRFIGTWGADDPEIVEKGGDDYKVIITFVSDGTGTYLQAGFDLPFTWYTSDGVLYMNMALAGVSEKPYSFSGNTLTMPDEDGRTTLFVKI